jgi:exosortase D (VPLPA-CTERM-specific)
MAKATKRDIIFRYLLLISVAALIFIYHDYLRYMLSLWGEATDSSGDKFFVQYHNFFFAVAAAILILLKTFKSELVGSGNALGVPLLLIALFLGLFGGSSAIYYVANVGFVLALVGLFVSCWGLDWAKNNWKPLALLLLLIPLPQFILIQIYTHLAAIAVKLSVHAAQLLGLSVVLEGNMVDFGGVSLNSLKAGEPFTYLILFISSGFFLINFIRAGAVRVILTVLSGPVILIALTVLRFIGIIWIANTRGAGAAESFSAATSSAGFLTVGIILQLLVFFLVRKTGIRKTEGPVPEQAEKTTCFPLRWPEMRSPRSALVSIALIVCAVLLSAGCTAPADREMPRKTFAGFPRSLGARQASAAPVDPTQLNSMQLKDYLSVDFNDSKTTGNLNVWIAYYGSQKPGGSIHSPKACLAGSGWDMSDSRVVTLNGLKADNRDILINRAIMKHGGQRQLIYFWYNVAGAQITNEYLVKWHIFWNKLTKHRTDGALIRLITPINDGEPEGAADDRLKGFMRDFLPVIPPYVPQA